MQPRTVRRSIGQYTASKIHITKTNEKQPTEVEETEVINQFGQKVKKRIYTDVRRTVFEEV